MSLSSTLTTSPSRPGSGRLRPATRGGRCWRRLSWPLLLLWIAVAVLATPLAGRLSDHLSDGPAASLPQGSQSTQVATLQDRAAHGRPAQQAVVIYSRHTGALSAADLRAVAQARTRLSALDRPGLGEPSPATVSPDRRAVVVNVGITPPSASDTATIDSDVAAVRSAARTALPSGLSVHVTGDAAITADSDGGNLQTTLLLTSAVIVAVLLLLTYRSAVLWVVPLVAAGIATQVAQAAALGLAESGLTVSSLASAILVVLVFGAATDYALLLVNRYRDELTRHASHHDALAVAVSRTVGALVASAGTVIAGLLVLLLAQLGNVRALGPVSAVGVACALAVQITFLPAALAVGGRQLLWPRAPRPGDAPRTRRTVWDRAAGLVARRPRTVLAATVALLAVMATGLLGLHGSLDPLDQLKGQPDSVVGARTLTDHFPAGQIEPLLVVVPTAARVPAVRQVIERTPGISTVSAADPIAGRPVLAAVLSSAPDGVAAGHTVDALRQRLAPERGVLVGGTPALSADYRAASDRDTVVLLPLILLVVGLVLCLLLRSLVAPLVLLASVALSFAASWGASVWAFTHLLGLHGVENGLTIFVFLFLVALGVDYTIFFMARVKEESVRVDTRTALRLGMTSTGGVITAAAFVLAGTFAALAQLPQVTLTQVGTAVAGGVLLDALLVRTLLVPAAVYLLGERIWWPRKRRSGHDAVHESPAAA